MYFVADAVTAVTVNNCSNYKHIDSASSTFVVGTYLTFIFGSPKWNCSENNKFSYKAT